MDTTPPIKHQTRRVLCSISRLFIKENILTLDYNFENPYVSNAANSCSLPAHTVKLQVRVSSVRHTRPHTVLIVVGVMAIKNVRLLPAIRLTVEAIVMPATTSSMHQIPKQNTTQDNAHPACPPSLSSSRDQTRF